MTDHGAASDPRVWPADPPTCDPLVTGCLRVRSRAERLWLVVEPGGVRCEADEALWERAGPGTPVRVRTSWLWSRCDGR